jgi:hypothetical protein
MEFRSLWVCGVRRATLIGLVSSRKALHEVVAQRRGIGPARQIFRNSSVVLHVPVFIEENRNNSFVVPVIDLVIQSVFAFGAKNRQQVLDIAQCNIFRRNPQPSLCLGLTGQWSAPLWVDRIRLQF